MQPTPELAIGKMGNEVRGGSRRGWRVRIRQITNLAAAVVVALALLGSANVDSFTQLRYSLDAKVDAWMWDLIAWEFTAVGRKVSEQFHQPAAGLTSTDQATLVQRYLTRAEEIRALEAQVERIYSERASSGAGASGAGASEAGARETGDAATAESISLQQQIDALRTEQDAARPAAEAILEGQVGAALVEEGITWFGNAFPPVWFTFSEPPMKMVVSPRARITSAHYAMLQPGVPVAERERIEQAISQENDLSAYITNIGGLGAYPTLVIDRAPLAWVLSTVAHEWVHNYLTLFPLGLNYSTTSDLTILNETVADIVGDEIGERVLALHYPEIAQDLAARAAAIDAGETAPPAFDFRKEMRHTREIVDQFLALGRVEDAEEYMEIRRLLFVENGYAIRTLNQAYFAFHGSYGASAAATSPIGPKLEELRSLTPDVRTFLETVRGFTTPEDLDKALEQWSKGILCVSYEMS